MLSDRVCEVCGLNRRFSLAAERVPESFRAGCADARAAYDVWAALLC